MLHYYRTGRHPADAQVLHRLREVERQAGIVSYPAAGDRLLPGDDVPVAGLEAHLRWLRGALLRQQEVVASAQRHLHEIEGWLHDAETELAARGQHRGGGSNSGGYSGPVPGAATYPMSDQASVSGASAPKEKEKRARLRDIATVSLPIFGYLPAGWPNSSEGVRTQHAPRKVPVRKGRFPDGAFGLEVRGDSMNAATPGAHPAR